MELLVKEVALRMSNMKNSLKIVGQILLIFITSFLLVMGFVFVCLLISYFVGKTVLESQCEDDKVLIESFCKEKSI